jgi:2-amino-4-hydroxy-6-hydroxymethyldihydropteridine diphosphokinase
LKKSETVFTRNKYHVYVILGGNIGDVRRSFEIASAMITDRLGPVLVSSSLYRTEPWGMDVNEYFYNQVLRVLSDLHPLDILRVLLGIEEEMGRKRSPGKMESRKIDIDILFIDDMIISEPGLEVPHPRLHLRRFALEPLAEVAPGLMHPIFDLPVKELLARCHDPLNVVRLSGQVAG